MNNAAKRKKILDKVKQSIKESEKADREFYQHDPEYKKLKGKIYRFNAKINKSKKLLKSLEDSKKGISQYQKEYEDNIKQIKKSKAKNTKKQK